MPVSPTYPGLYIEELPSQTHTITAAPTSVTVFIGYTHPFKTNPDANGAATFGTPTELFSFSDYERLFGGLYNTPSVDSNVAYAVQQFFLNGGSDAFVVGLEPQVFNPTDGTQQQAFFPATTVFSLDGSNGNMTFSALEPADAQNPIVVTFSNQRSPSTSSTTGYGVADITITYGSQSEVFRGVSGTATSANYIGTKLASSRLVALTKTDSSKADFGLFPPYDGTAPRTLSFKLSYIAYQVSFPNSPMQFAPKGPAIGAPLTITFSNQSSYTVPTGSPLGPSGYMTADLKIVSGTHSETYTGISADPASPNYILTLINGAAAVGSTPAVPASTLVTLTTVTTGGTDFGLLPPLNPARPAAPATAPVAPQSISLPVQELTPFFSAQDFEDVVQADTLLDKISVLNIMAIPGITDPGVLSAAIAFCEAKRAFLLMDMPQQDTSQPSSTPIDVTGVDALVSALASSATPNLLSMIPSSINAALYFPYLRSPDPVSGTTINLPPSGFVAGILARTDLNRGVWKAPAGLETTINNVTGVIAGGTMTDMQAGVLNTHAINAIRTFSGSGTVVFGARTIAATNLAFQQWKYVPVRRTALFIEQTLYANLGWVVFEPNDVPLWTAVRTSIERFMLSLFRQGAFQGTTPSEAFLVKCDSSTTTQDDIDNGRVNILVGFQPLKPAEFVVIQITQLAGQASS